MKRLFGWLAGAVGAGAAYRALRRRPDVGVPEADPAQALRAKLAETKAVEPEPEPEVPESVDERRRSVHDEARAAIDELRG